MSDRDLKRLTLRELMEAWLRTKNPDEEYQWSEGRDCACSQFARAIGQYEQWYIYVNMTNCNMVIESPWRELNWAAQQERTFGGLLARLQEK